MRSAVPAPDGRGRATGVGKRVVLSGGLLGEGGDGVRLGQVNGVATRDLSDGRPLGIAGWAGGGIIRSSVATRYQLGLTRHAGSATVPSRAATPYGTCESAMNAACAAGRSPANEAWKRSRSTYR